MRGDIAQLSAHLPLNSERSRVTGHRRNGKKPRLEWQLTWNRGSGSEWDLRSRRHLIATIIPICVINIVIL